MPTILEINCVSIGGSAIPYGNVLDDSSRYGNYKLEYMCQFLRNSNKTVGMHYFQNGNNNEDIVKKLSGGKIFIFLMDFLNNKKILSIASKLKQKDKDVSIIVFGRFVDFKYKEILIANDCIDYCCLGSPYKSINYLIDCIVNQIKINNEHIATRFSLNKIPELESNLEKWPCFDFYENDTFKNNRKKTHIITTKNEFCVGKCTFCWSEKEKIIYKSCDRIVEEIDFISSKYGIRNFLFVDNDFFDLLTLERKEELILLLNKIDSLHKNLNFSCFARSNSIKEKHRDLYKLMKKVGFSCIFIGVDTGNEIDRKLYNKIPSIHDNITALDILKEVGIFTRIGFISVNPYSTLTTLKENFLFLKKIKSPNYYHYGGLRLMLLPGTPIYYKVIKDNLLYNDDSIYGYNFSDPKVESFINAANLFFQKIKDHSIIDYLTLRRYYEYGTSINKKIQNRYSALILNYEEEEFLDITELFEELYTNENIEKFIKNIDITVQKIVKRAENNSLLISEIKEIIYNTPIDKGGEFDG